MMQQIIIQQVSILNGSIIFINKSKLEQKKINISDSRFRKKNLCYTAHYPVGKI